MQIAAFTALSPAFSPIGNFSVRANAPRSPSLRQRRRDHALGADTATWSAVTLNDPAEVLLVDDDVLLSASIMEMLSLLAYRVTWASSIEEAMIALGHNRVFDVMLLDLRLGDDRGERIVEVAVQHRICLPPVVIFSAQPDVELGLAATHTSARAVLRKPCSLAGMRHALDRASATS